MGIGAGVDMYGKSRPPPGFDPRTRSHGLSVGNPEGERKIARLKRIWEDNIRLDNGVSWIHLIKREVGRGILCKRFAQKGGYSLIRQTD